MARFCMPYNGDPQLIEAVLAEYGDHICSFYGSLFRDGLGGGRVLDAAHAHTLDDLAPIVKALARKGIRFNYVVSGTHALNREFDPEYQRRFLDFISSLREIGISIITLANITLIELVKATFADLTVSASVNLRTRSPQDVSYLLHIGCDEITLHYDIHKDRSILAAIRALTSIDLKLIPNDIFIMACPWHKSHTRMQAAHTRDKGFSTPYFNYYRNKCVNLRHHRQDEIFKAMWIAPTSLPSFERLGYDYFKLLDRNASTDWNLRALDAYVRQSDSALELILGTYGAPSTSTQPEPCNAADGPYPTHKLEVVPSINTASRKSKTALAYFLDPRHPQDCGSCSICGQAAAPAFSPSTDYLERAIENNRTWQYRITKPAFVKSLQDYMRDNGYK